MVSQSAVLTPEIEAIAARIPEAPPGVRGSREEIAEAVAAIAREFDPDQIVLFGSRAYGESTSSSDIDLMVILDTPLVTRDQRAAIQEFIPHPIRFDFDIRVGTPKSIAIGLAEGDFFIEDVMLKGITLFRRQRTAMVRWLMAPGNTDRDGRQTTLKQATRGWINRAKSHWRAAQHLLIAADPLCDAVVVHSHLCAEAYLKSLLQERRVRFPRMAPLDQLAQLAERAVVDFALSASDLKWLPEYAVLVRYPEVWAGESESTRAIQIAEDVRSTVRKTLGLENGGNDAGQAG